MIHTHPPFLKQCLVAKSWGTTVLDNKFEEKQDCVDWLHIQLGKEDFILIFAEYM